MDLATPVVAKPRAAYVHVPFCRHRCGYCNFTLVAGRDELIDAYLSALATELSWLETPREVATLFFGGGTPTHLRGSQLEHLLSTVLRWHPLHYGAEFSVEANPADVDADTIQVLVRHGVTRISLGAQSFDDEKLRLLERDHDTVQIERAVALAQNSGLQVSLDLIFGLPGETAELWKCDLEAALQLRPDHISTYGLTFESGTAFWNRREKGELKSLDEELERTLYETAIDCLTAAGYEHYEVSNFAQPSKRCRHNETYWTGEQYFAAGPGAARYLGGVRETNQRSVLAWLASIEAGKRPIAEREELPPTDRARELFVFAMRRLEGVRRDWFRTRSGLDLDELVGTTVREFVSAGLLRDDGNCVRLSLAGLLVSDALWPRFL